MKEQEHPFKGQARVSCQPAASLSGRQEAVGMKTNTSMGAAKFSKPEPLKLFSLS